MEDVVEKPLIAAVASSDPLLPIAPYFTSSLTNSVLYPFHAKDATLIAVGKSAADLIEMSFKIESATEAADVRAA